MKRSALQNKFAREDREARLEFLKAAMQHEAGRTFLWWLLQIGKFGSQPFAQNALTMSFGCGEMNVGCQILAELVEAVPSGLPTLMTEQAEIARTRREKLASAKEDSSEETEG